MFIFEHFRDNEIQFNFRCNGKCQKSHNAEFFNNMGLKFNVVGRWQRIVEYNYIAKCRNHNLRTKTIENLLAGGHISWITLMSSRAISPCQLDPTMPSNNTYKNVKKNTLKVLFRWCTNLWCHAKKNYPNIEMAVLLTH